MEISVIPVKPPRQSLNIISYNGQENVTDRKIIYYIVQGVEHGYLKRGEFTK